MKWTHTIKQTNKSKNSSFIQSFIHSLPTPFVQTMVWAKIQSYTWTRSMKKSSECKIHISTVFTVEKRWGNLVIRVYNSLDPNWLSFLPPKNNRWVQLLFSISVLQALRSFNSSRQYWYCIVEILRHDLFLSFFSFLLNLVNFLCIFSSL